MNFGRRNVFIDLAKFPLLLEQRLVSCKVMLVLIGPGWLNALLLILALVYGLFRVASSVLERLNGISMALLQQAPIPALDLASNPFVAWSTRSATFGGGLLRHGNFHTCDSQFASSSFSLSKTKRPREGARN
jgi:hypothetical protein